MKFGDVKKWWQSKAMGGGFGLLAMALGVIAGVTISGDDLSYVYNQVPVVLGATGILVDRVRDWSKGVSGSGYISLLLAFVGSGVGVLPPDILEQWHIVQSQGYALIQVLFVVLAGFGLHLSEKKIAKEII